MFESFGTITRPLAFPSGIHALNVDLDVVTEYVTELAGLNSSKISHSLFIRLRTAYAVTDRLKLLAQSGLIMLTTLTDDESRGRYVMDEWHMSLNRNQSNIYVDRETLTCITYTRWHLNKVLRQLCYATAGSLYKFLKTANPSIKTAETMKDLQELTRRCDPCQRIPISLITFKAALGA